MDITLCTPSVSQLPHIADSLALWQRDPWPGHLHPGDLGWHSSAGPEQMAKDLRVWQRDGDPLAVGMLDGSDVLRMAIRPDLAHDHAVARDIGGVLSDDGLGVFTGDDAIVEARGAAALIEILRAGGWVDDEPWTPMIMDLAGRLDLARVENAQVRVVEVGPEAAEEWTCVHWSSFKGTPFDAQARDSCVQRWTRMMTGPFSDRAHSLIAYDESNVPVAVTTVWTAGVGSPGLVEPMGVHRDHLGKGYGVVMTLAGVQTLQQLGASSAAVVAENSNPAAVATYRSASFRSYPQVCDLRRP